MSPWRPPRTLAAAWWSASLGRWSRPIVGAGGALGGASLVLPGCAGVLEESPGPSALDVQHQESWNVGGEGRPLWFPFAQETDVAGSTSWRQAMTTLALRLAPRDAAWMPFYDPTLFQALSAPRSAELLLMMRPIATPDMSIAARRGDALLSLFTSGGCRSDVAVVLDLPGPESVALAAALAPCLEPVFVLDNWPHPKAVVPSHLTLAAALYYLPSFQRERARRAAGAAPVFVLDRARLTPYSDDGDRFDNRYFVSLPSQASLAAAGIRHVLYVMPDAESADSDDLNEDLVGLDRAGLDVRMLAMTDFAQTPPPGWPDTEPAPELRTVALPSPSPSPYYFGGSPGAHGCFWSWYGWGPPCAPAGGMTMALSLPAPPRLAPRFRGHPVARGKPPSGFRGTAVSRTMGVGGFQGTPVGGGLRGGGSGFAMRSGSLGRAGGGFSG